MFRAILPDGQLLCEQYEHTDQGVTLYDGDDEFIAFVPYANLQAVVNEDSYTETDRSIM